MSSTIASAVPQLLLYKAGRRLCANGVPPSRPTL